MNHVNWERVPMDRIHYEGGENQDRFVVLVVTKRYGGNPLSPLYEPQARQLMKQARDAGYLVRAIRLGRDGETIDKESDF
jgi:hypothetical protein